MFTGIIREIGSLKEKRRLNKGSVCFKIACGKLKPAPLESVAVNGVCLTVVEKTAAGFTVDVVPETLSRTNLGKLRLGDPLNLEPSLRMGDKFDGHFVSGHIDGIAKILKRGKIQPGRVSARLNHYCARRAQPYGIGLIIELPKKLAAFIVEKGSVALNGVSLTVADVKQNEFSVALIPTTIKHTNLGKLKRGDFVNIEIDMIARYISKIYENRHRGFTIQ